MIIFSFVKAAYSPLLVSRSLRINLNKWLLIMGKFRFNFQKKGEGTAGDTKRGNAKQYKARGREKWGGWQIKQGGRWNELLNHQRVCQQRWKSRPAWRGAEGVDVKILNSVLQTLSSTTCFLPFLSLYPPLPPRLLWWPLLLLLPANSKWLSPSRPQRWSVIATTKNALSCFNTVCTLGIIFIVLFITQKLLWFVKLQPLVFFKKRI